jgi:hypothetical protein
MKKTFIAVTAIAGALALGSTALAGPGPGLPSYGARVTDSQTEDPQTTRSRDDAPYALTGASQRARSGASGPQLVQHYGRGGQKAGVDPRTDSSN